VEQAAPKGQCSQRLRRWAEWAEAPLDDRVAALGTKEWQPRHACTPASACPQAARTTTRSIACSSIWTEACLLCAPGTASGLLPPWLGGRGPGQGHLHPYGPPLRYDHLGRSSPFANLKGFHYHPLGCSMS
jgi:hypothetical protein